MWKDCAYFLICHIWILWNLFSAASLIINEHLQMHTDACFGKYRFICVCINHRKVFFWFIQGKAVALVTSHSCASQAANPICLCFGFHSVTLCLTQKHEGLCWQPDLCFFACYSNMSDPCGMLWGSECMCERVSFVSAQQRDCHLFSNTYVSIHGCLSGWKSSWVNGSDFQSSTAKLCDQLVLVVSIQMERLKPLFSQKNGIVNTQNKKIKTCI